MTPFATQTRALRKDRGVLLGQLAERLGCTPSFLSQIEAGTKPIPDGLVGKIARALGLSPREAGALENAAALSAKEYRIAMPRDAREQDRAIAHKLSLGFASLSTKKKQRILEVLQEGDDA